MNSELVSTIQHNIYIIGTKMMGVNLVQVVLNVVTIDNHYATIYFHDDEKGTSFSDSGNIYEDMLRHNMDEDKLNNLVVQYGFRYAEHSITAFDININNVDSIINNFVSLVKAIF